MEPYPDDGYSHLEATLTPGEVGLGKVTARHLFSEFRLYVYWPKMLNFEEDANDGEFKELVNYSSEWLRYFFEMYRYTVGPLSIRVNDAAQIKFPIITLYENGKITPEEVIGHRTSKIKGILTVDIGMFPVKTDTTPQKIQGLESHLVSNLSIGLYLQLIMDAEDQISIFQRYDLSTVISGTAFEVFLKSHLTSLCALKNMEKIKIGKGKNKKEVKSDDYIEKANPMELLSVIQDVIATPIKGTKHHSDWFSKAYTPRNNIVHRGANTFTKEAANKAVEAVHEYMKYITSVS